MNQHETRQYLAHFQAALDSEAGIELEYLDATDAGRAQQIFYRLRRKHPEYSSIVLSKQEDRLWLINTEAHDEED